MFVFSDLLKNVIYKYKMTNKNAKCIPKCDFHTLLNDCLNNMNIDKKTNTNEQIKNNLVSGFKATGIMPFNPDSVLRRLPDYNDDHTNEVADNLIEFLKEQRFSSSTQMI
jgi:superfamily I DNA/RNA helicase